MRTTLHKHTVYRSSTDKKPISRHLLSRIFVWFMVYGLSRENLKKKKKIKIDLERVKVEKYIV